MNESDFWIWLVVAYVVSVPFAVFVGLVRVRVMRKRDKDYPWGDDDSYGIVGGILWPFTLLVIMFSLIFGKVPELVAKAADATAERITAEPSDEYLLRPAETETP